VDTPEAWSVVPTPLRVHSSSGSGIVVSGWRSARRTADRRTAPRS
jgi:hypothetical protein